MNKLPYTVLTPQVFTDERGTLNCIETLREIPFEIKRIFYIHHVPIGTQRGGHAHRKVSECLIPIAGSFDLVIDNGEGSPHTLKMSSESSAILLPAMTWRTLKNFSNDAVCLVLCSEAYDSEDYIYGYSHFRQLRLKRL